MGLNINRDLWVARLWLTLKIAFSPAIGVTVAWIAIGLFEKSLFDELPEFPKLDVLNADIQDQDELTNLQSLNISYELMTQYIEDIKKFVNNYIETIEFLISLAGGIFIGLLTTVALSFFILFWHLDRLKSISDAIVSLKSLPKNLSDLDKKFDSLEKDHNIIAYSPREKNRFINIYNYSEGELPELGVQHLKNKLNGEKSVLISYLIEDNFENLLLSDGYISKFVAAAGDIEGAGSRIQQNRIIITKKDDKDIGLKIFSQLSEALNFPTVVMLDRNFSKLSNYYVNKMKEDERFVEKYEDIKDWKVEDFYKYISGKANIMANTENVFSQVKDGCWYGGANPVAGSALPDVKIRFYMEWLNQNPKKLEDGGFSGSELTPSVVFSFVFGRLLLKKGKNLSSEGKSTTYFLKPFDFEFDPTVGEGTHQAALERRYWDEVFEELSADMIEIMSSEKT